MANRTIDTLTAATQINDNDLFVLQQSAEAKKLAGDKLKQYINYAAVNGIKTAVFNESYQLVLTLQDNTVITSPSLRGAQGEQGEQGDDGVGISSIAKTSTSGLVDTYTITYTDGDTSTFTVTNGAKGDQGDKGDKGDTGDTGATGNGIASITKTGTVGKVDTYTITFTDGTTTTFTVTNGQDGQGSGDMTKAVYDDDDTVADAGGIVDYVGSYHDSTKITNPSTKSDGQALIYNASTLAWEAGDVSTKAEVDIADNSTESLPTPASGETHEDLPQIFVREETDSSQWYTKAETDTLLASKVSTSAIGNVATLSYTVVSTF